MLDNVVFILLKPIIQEPHGVLSLISVLRKNKVNVNIIISNSPQKIQKKLDKIRPDAVCFSAIWGTHSQIIKLANSLNKNDSKFIIGGPAVTY